MLSRRLTGSNRQRVDCVHGFSCRHGRGRSLPAAGYENIAGAKQQYSKQSANFHPGRNFFSGGIFMQNYQADTSEAGGGGQRAGNHGREKSEHTASHTKQYVSIFITHVIIHQQNTRNPSDRPATQATSLSAKKDHSVYMCIQLSNSRIYLLDLPTEQRFQHVAHGALEFAAGQLTKKRQGD